MKKILAFILAVIMVFSLTTLCACGKSDDDGNVSTNDEIITSSALVGEWKVTSTDAELEWFMNAQGVLHITESINGQKITTVCEYTYDKETQVFEYTGLSADVSFKGTATIDSDNVTLTSEDNSQVITLRKIS